MRQSELSHNRRRDRGKSEEVFPAGRRVTKLNSDFMKDLVYAKNPAFALIPKNESTDGLAGKYIPVPIQYADPMGRSHTFANAQGNQTPNQYNSFFVYVVNKNCPAKEQSLAA